MDTVKLIFAMMLAAMVMQMHAGQYQQKFQEQLYFLRQSDHCLK